MRLGWRLAVAVTLTAGSLALAGCQNFFVCDKASCTTNTGSGSSGSGDTTTDFAFVGYTSLDSSNNATATIAGYNIGSGALTATNSVTLSFVPLSIAVAPSNNFLYVASLPSAANPGIYAYSISSTGTLTALNSGNPLVTEEVAGMAISPDGNYLYTIDATGGVTQAVTQYTVNTSTGGLTASGTAATSTSSCSLLVTVPAVRPCDIKVSPAGAYVAIALGSGGENIYPYSSSSGITSQTPIQFTSGNTALNDFAVAWDKNNYLYIARTTQLTDYSVTSSGATQVSFASYASGTQPRAVALNSTYGYVFTANPTAATISGFSINSSGQLTAQSPATVAAPTGVSTLAFDKSGGYAVAAGNDASAGLELFSVTSAGVLAKLATAGTTATTTYPLMLAVTY